MIELTRITHNRVLTALLTLFAGTTFAFFGRLFPMIEYRELILYSTKKLDPHYMSIAFSRTFSIVIIKIVDAVCGIHSAAHNAFHIALFVASGWLFWMTLRRLVPAASPMLCGAALTFMLFSASVMDALCWQSTIFDKLALFLSMFATYIIASLDIRSLSKRTIFTLNVKLFLLIVAAYNAKEAAFALLPSLVLLLSIRFLQTEPIVTPSSVYRSLRNGIAPLVAPALYAVFHVTTVLLHPPKRALQFHFYGGHPDFNAYHFFIYLFNAETLAHHFNVFPYAPQEILNVTLTLAVIIFITSAFFVLRTASRSTTLLWIWAAGSFLLSFAIPLRTYNIPPYYMVVPQAYLAMLFFLTLFALRSYVPNVFVRRFVVLGALAAFLCGLSASSPPYLRMARMSDNFSDALTRTQTAITQAPGLPGITLLWPKRENKAYFFLGPPDNPTLAPYLLPQSFDHAQVLAFDASIEALSYVTPPQPPTRSGHIFVILGDELRLERLVMPR